MGIAFTITIPYSLWLRSKIRTFQFAPLQFLVDLIMVTGLVYFSGGIHSEFTLLYPLVILSAGIAVNPKQAAAIKARYQVEVVACLGVEPSVDLEPLRLSRFR